MFTKSVNIDLTLYWSLEWIIGAWSIIILNILVSVSQHRSFFGLSLSKLVVTLATSKMMIWIIDGCLRLSTWLLKWTQVDFENLMARIYRIGLIVRCRDGIQLCSCGRWRMLELVNFYRSLMAHIKRATLIKIEWTLTPSSGWQSARSPVIKVCIYLSTVVMAEVGQEWSLRTSFS